MTKAEERRLFLQQQSQATPAQPVAQPTTSEPTKAEQRRMQLAQQRASNETFAPMLTQSITSGIQRINPTPSIPTQTTLQPTNSRSNVIQPIEQPTPSTVAPQRSFTITKKQETPREELSSILSEKGLGQNEVNTVLSKMSDDQVNTFLQDTKKTAVDRAMPMPAGKERTTAELVGNAVKDTASTIGKATVSGAARLIDAGKMAVDYLSLNDSTFVNADDLYNYANGGRTDKDKVAMKFLFAVSSARPDDVRIQTLYNEIKNGTYKGTKEDIQKELEDSQALYHDMFYYNWVDPSVEKYQEQKEQNKIAHSETGANILNTAGDITEVAAPAILASTVAPAPVSMGLGGAISGQKKMEQYREAGKSYTEAAKEVPIEAAKGAAFGAVLNLASPALSLGIKPDTSLLARIGIAFADGTMVGAGASTVSQLIDYLKDDPDYDYINWQHVEEGIKSGKYQTLDDYLHSSEFTQDVAKNRISQVILSGLITAGYNVVGQVANGIKVSKASQQQENTLKDQAGQYLKTLGLKEGATREQVKAAYRQLSRTLHPDINPNGAEEFTKVNEAYNALTKNPNYAFVFGKGVTPVAQQPAQTAQNATPQQQALIPQTASSLANAPQPEVAGVANTAIQNVAPSTNIVTQATPTEVKTPEPSRPSKMSTDTALEDIRSFKGAGDKKINAYQYDNPEVKPFFQHEAKNMLQDLDRAIKGEATATWNDYGELNYTGTTREVTDDIAELLDGDNGVKLSYDDIRKGLNAIINDQGSENIAAAKRIEMILDRRLREGYVDSYGTEYKPNQNYQNFLEGKDWIDPDEYERQLAEKMYAEENNQETSSYIPKDISIKDSQGREIDHRIHTESTAAYSDQVNMIKYVADEDGNIISKIDYSYYDGKIYVNMMETQPEYKNKGLMTSLLDDLQKDAKEEGMQIDYGYTTPEGTKFLKGREEVDRRATEQQYLEAPRGTYDGLQFDYAKHDKKIQQEIEKKVLEAVGNDFNKDILAERLKEGITEADRLVSEANRAEKPTGATEDLWTINTRARTILEDMLHDLNQGKDVRNNEIYKEFLKNSNQSSFSNNAMLPTNEELTQNETNKIANEPIVNVENETTEQPPDNMKVRKHVETIANAPGTPKEVAKDIRNDTRKYYVPKTNEETMENAKAIIGDDYDRAERTFLQREGLQTEEDVAIGDLLLQKAIEQGDYKKADDLAIALAEKFTTVGRTLQAANMIKQLSPEGMLVYAEKELNNATRTIKKENPNFYKKLKEQGIISKNGSKVEKIQLTDTEKQTILENMQKVQTMPDGREKDILVAKTMRLIGDKIPATALEKVASLRRNGLLLNIKTLNRNIGSNGVFGLLENIKDIPAAAIDSAVSLVTGQRTTKLPNLKAQIKGFIKGGKEALQDLYYGIDTTDGTEGKYGAYKKTFKREDWKDIIDAFKEGETKAGAKRVFKRMLSDYEDAAMFLVNGTDRPFWQARFEGELANQMKLNGLKYGEDMPTDEMLEIAKESADYATFKNKNALSSVLSGLKNKLNFGKPIGAADALGLTFTNVPGSVGSKISDYTFGGYAKAIKEIYNAATKNGKFDQRKFVNYLARAITGTGLVALLIPLFKNKILIGSYDDDKDKADIEREMGIQQNSINVSALERYVEGKDPAIQEGDKFYNFDWLQPVSGLAILGANIYKASTQGTNEPTEKIASNLDDENDYYVKKKTTANAGDIALETIRTAANQVADMSSLGNFADLFRGYDGLGGNLVDIPGNFVSSFIPTLSNNLGQYTDEKARNTKDYTSKTNTNINKLMNKIPGLRTLLEPKVNTMGEEKQQYVNGNDFVSTFINPGYLTTYSPTDIQKELESVYEETGDKTIYPSLSPSSITSKKETVTLKPKGVTTYQKASGKYASEAYEGLLDNEYYKSLEASDKAKVLSKIAKDSQDIGKAAIGIETDNYFKLDTKREELDKGTMALADYYLYASQINMNDSKSKKKTYIANITESMNNKQGKNYIDKRDKEILYDIFGVN